MLEIDGDAKTTEKEKETRERDAREESAMFYLHLSQWRNNGLEAR